MSKSIYVCQNCGTEYMKWTGHCTKCNGWNTIEEQVLQKSEAKRHKKAIVLKTKKISEVNPKDTERLPTNIPELDRVLSGGLVKGQVILLSGTPGVGKSTLLLQLINSCAKVALYASGEESEEQIAVRAKRLSINNDSIDLISSTNLDDIINTFEKSEVKYNFLIIDSIQTVKTEMLTSRIGSTSQIKESSAMLTEFAKKNNVPVILVGHITKSGDIAGPKLLEHIVDTVLLMEGDRNHIFRLIKVKKNRFGDTSEVGIFDMKNEGLISVENPTQYFYSENLEKIAGNATSVILEGVRPILVEVQALVNKTPFGFARRTANGFNLNKLNLLCAVIHKKLGIDLSDQDVYVNIPSGLKIDDPSIDLAVVFAIVSSYKNKSLPNKSALMGEVGLSGEIRAVAQHKKREQEANKLGFQNVFSKTSHSFISDLAKQIF